ncbi:MAG: glycine radical domain-containing protein [Neglectibacter timonensis]
MSWTEKRCWTARKHPENHRDLIVRIGGYSDYYVRLSDALQEEILERREY